ncbi:hypothetical protein CBR_g23934 [Chara braunii]|uniref:Peptidase A2 domain-containing protein n=1 Tax=Chara braunii TaxID=69332 RepID=A0A388L5B4_CHABU|nr:hypothetical protein CBR_g23934 [Chara braunii]|eukprot:GBG77487.1 hypothetical protein CBR_g23934 [Chara braunii]
MDGEIYDRWGKHIDPKTPGGIRQEALRRAAAGPPTAPTMFRVWQEREDPGVRAEEIVDENEEVTQRLKAGTIKEEPIVVESDDEAQEVVRELASTILERMEDLLAKVGRYQERLRAMCEEAREWEMSLPEVMLYGFGPESSSGPQGCPSVATAAVGPRSGMTFKPPTSHGRVPQAAQTRGQSKATASQGPSQAPGSAPPRKAPEPERRKEVVEVQEEEDEGDDEEDERLRQEEDRRAEQRAKKKGIQGGAEPSLHDGVPKRKKYVVRLEEGFDVERMVDNLLEGHNDLMNLKDILASAPRLCGEMKGRLSRRLVPNVHLSSILTREIEWTEAGTKMDWKCVACGLVDLKVRDQPSIAMVDTGAEMNIIREWDATMLGLEVDHSDHGVLHGANCKAIFCGTTSNVMVKIGRVRARTCFFVMPDVDHPILLGRSFLCRTETLVFNRHEGTMILALSDPACGNYEIIKCQNTGPGSVRNMLNLSSFIFEESEYARWRLREQQEEEGAGKVLSLSRNDVNKAMEVVAAHDMADPEAIKALREQVQESPQVGEVELIYRLPGRKGDPAMAQARTTRNKNRADRLSRINWDGVNQESIEDTPPVDGFLDQEEDVRLHINEWSLRVPSCVMHPIWLAPRGYERKEELVLKPFQEEDPWGSRDVGWMMKLALAGTHSLAEENPEMAAEQPDPVRPQGGEVITVGDDTPPHSPVSEPAQHSWPEGILEPGSEEIPESPPEATAMPEQEAEAEDQGVRERARVETPLDLPSAMHVTKSPVIEGPVPAELPPAVPCTSEGMGAEASTPEGQGPRVRRTPREIRDEKSARVRVRLDEIHARQAEMEAAGIEPTPPIEPKTSEHRIDELWARYESQRDAARQRSREAGQTDEETGELREMGDLGFSATRQTIERMDRRIWETTVTSFQWYNLLSNELRVIELEGEHLTTQVAEERVRSQAREVEWERRFGEMATTVDRLSAAWEASQVGRAGADGQGRGMQASPSQGVAVEVPRQAEPMEEVPLDVVEEEGGAQESLMAMSTERRGSRLHELAATMGIGTPQEGPQRLDASEHAPRLGELRAELGSWATGTDSGGPDSQQQQQQEAMSEPTAMGGSQPSGACGDEVVVTEGPHEKGPRELDMPNCRSVSTAARGGEGAEAMEPGPQGHMGSSSCHEVTTETTGTPSASSSRGRKKKTARWHDTSCFWCKEEGHRAVDYPELLEDKAEGRVAEFNGKFYDRQGRIVERAPDGGMAQLYRQNQEELCK